MRRGDLKASEATRCFQPLPQALRNVRFDGDNPLERDAVKACVKEVEASLGGRGRVVVRKSGTEPLVRLMVEAEEEALVSQALDTLETRVRESG